MPAVAVLFLNLFGVFEILFFPVRVVSQLLYRKKQGGDERGER